MFYKKCLIVVLILFVAFASLNAQVDLKKKNTQIGLNSV